MRRSLLALAIAAFVIATLTSALHLLSASARDGTESVEVDQGLQGLGRVRHPLFLQVHGRDAQGAPLVTNSTPIGYAPAQVQSYLGLHGDGAGQTIAIVDAYDDPNAVADLNTFSSTFGLPLICGTAGANPANCFNFTKATPQGQPRSDAGWSLEIALDVEWAHAVAPKAAILLVEAASNGFSNLLGAIDYASQHGAVVVSNSWGAGEFSDETAFDSHCATTLCTFSSGDSGHPGLYPAYNPYAIAVGGTTLKLTNSGVVTSESAWSGSGGGVSQYEARPSYQSSINANANRGMPDVSYNADPGTGFAVYDSVRYQRQSGWFQVGGTSAGAPQWAAIVGVSDQLLAAANEGPLTAANFDAATTLYGLPGTGVLYDVTSGSNGSCGSLCAAGPGYDFVTGLGSPRAGIDTFLSGAVPAGEGTATPTSTATTTPTPTRTPTSTPTPTRTPTSTPTPTRTPTSTPTATSTYTETPTDSPTATATDTPTDTPTETSTETPTPSDTPTPTPMPWPCADFNGDGIVSTADILYVVDHYNPSDPAADLNGDGTVTTVDVLIAIAEYNITCQR